MSYTLSMTNGTLKAGTKYRIENEDGTFSGYFVLPVDTKVEIVALTDEDGRFNIYQDETGTWMYVNLCDEVV